MSSGNSVGRQRQDISYLRLPTTSSAVWQVFTETPELPKWTDDAKTATFNESQRLSIDDAVRLLLKVGGQLIAADMLRGDIDTVIVIHAGRRLSRIPLSIVIRNNLPNGKPAFVHFRDNLYWGLLSDSVGLFKSS